MNKDLLIQRRTESSGLDESVRAQLAQISCLDQERVVKTVIKYGNERIELEVLRRGWLFGVTYHNMRGAIASAAAAWANLFSRCAAIHASTSALRYFDSAPSALNPQRRSYKWPNSKARASPPALGCCWQRSSRIS